MSLRVAVVLSVQKNDYCKRRCLATAMPAHRRHGPVLSEGATWLRILGAVGVSDALLRSTTLLSSVCIVPCSVAPSTTSLLCSLSRTSSNWSQLIVGTHLCTRVVTAVMPTLASPTSPVRTVSFLKDECLITRWFYSSCCVQGDVDEQV